MPPSWSSTSAQISGIFVRVRNYPANLGHPGREAGRASGRAAGGAPERDGPTVAIVVSDGVTVFELGVACDVFGDEWAAISGVPWYRSFVCGITRGPVTTDSGFQILPAHGPGRIRSASTVIVLPTVSADAVPGGDARSPAPGARPGQPHRVAVHGRLRPGRRRAAGRAPRHHALDRMRLARPRASPGDRGSRRPVRRRGRHPDLSRQRRQHRPVPAPGPPGLRHRDRHPARPPARRPAPARRGPGPVHRRADARARPVPACSPAPSTGSRSTWTSRSPSRTWRPAPP